MTRGEIQVAMNGDRVPSEHSALPWRVDGLARDATACAAAGATSFHIHPRDEDGRERLDADVIDEAVHRIRDATGLPVGVSTGAWIEPDLSLRLSLIAAWTAPDYASVNVGEDGFDEVMRCLIQQRIGIEVGISTLEDVERFASSGLADRGMRILVEPYGEDLGATVQDALRYVERLHQALDDARIATPRLQHSDGTFTWAVLEDALRRGLDTRIGLEDTLHLPDGAIAEGNAALVASAVHLRDSIIA